MPRLSTLTARRMIPYNKPKNTEIGTTPAPIMNGIKSIPRKKAVPSHDGLKTEMATTTNKNARITETRHPNNPAITAPFRISMSTSQR